MNTRTLFPLALFLAACPDPKTTPTGDTETTAPEDTAPTGTVPEVDLDFPARNLFIRGDFGWDSATSSIVNPVDRGFEIVTRVEILVTTDAWLAGGYDFYDTAEYCVINLVFTEGPAAFSPTAQTDLTVYFGVDHSGDPADVLTNCNDPEHNIGDLFGTDIATTLATASPNKWGLAIGSLSDNMLSVFDDIGWTAADYELLVGARIFNTNFFFSPALEDDGFFALPVALDENLEAVIDDAGTAYVTVPADDVFTGSALATAWYRIDTFSYAVYNSTF